MTMNQSLPPWNAHDHLGRVWIMFSKGEDQALSSREYPDFCVLSHTLPKEREYGDQERDFGRVAEG